MNDSNSAYLCLVRDLILRLRLDDAVRGLAREAGVLGDHATAQPLQKTGGQFSSENIGLCFTLF